MIVWLSQKIIKKNDRRDTKTNHILHFSVSSHQKNGSTQHSVNNSFFGLLDYNIHWLIINSDFFVCYWIADHRLKWFLRQWMSVLVHFGQHGPARRRRIHIIWITAQSLQRIISQSKKLVSGHKIYFTIGLSPQTIISYSFRNGYWLSVRGIDEQNYEKTIQRGFRMVPSKRSVSYTKYSIQIKRSRTYLSLSKGYMCHWLLFMSDVGRGH